MMLKSTMNQQKSGVIEADESGPGKVILFDWIY